MNNNYNLSTDEVLKKLNTSMEGISGKEIDRLRGQYGFNELKAENKAGFF